MILAMPVTLPSVQDERGRMDRASSSFLHFRQRGDLAALGEVFDLLAGRLYSLALHLCRAPADAEDLVQATFVVAMQKASSFDPGREVAAWLGGILAGEARNLLRREGRRATAPLEDAVGPAATPGELAERKELVQQLRTHVEALPDEQRQVLLLQLEHGLQPAEIAEVLGVPAGTVRVRVHRGLAALRRLLPASLATLLLGQLSARGLAAVKQAVLQQARVATAASAAVGFGAWTFGVLMMKQVMTVMGLLLLALATWWGVTPSEPARVPTVDAGPSPAKVQSTPAAAGVGTDSSAPELASPAPVQRTELPDRGSLRIEVVWKGDGTGVQDVALTLWPAGGPQPAVEPIAAARTDADGVAMLAGLPAGEHAVEFRPDGKAGLFRHEARKVSVPKGGQEQLRIELPRAWTLRGHAVDESGAPVADAVLFASTGAGRRGPEFDAEAWRRVGRSGADGSFAVGFAMGEYMLGACSADHAAAGVLRIGDGDAKQVLVLPWPHGLVAGIVRDARGAPIAGARVLVRLAAPRERRLADGTEVSAYAPMQECSEADGRFTLPGLEAGEHIIEVQKDGFAPWTQRLSVALGSVQDLAILLRAEATLAVTVRDAAGEPVPVVSLAVWCGDLDARYPTRELLVAADGDCVLRQLPEGRVRVRATRFGSGRAEQDLTLQAGQQRALALQLVPRVGIRGRLVDKDGAAVAGSAVTATDETWDMTQFRDRQQDPFGTVSAEDGSFDLRDLGPYPFRLQARARNGDAVLLAEHVEPGPVQRTFVVPDRGSAATITGKVVGPDGQPVANARVAPWRTGANGAKGALTDAQGRFELGSLAPGEYTVGISADGLLGMSTSPVAMAVDERRDLGVLQLQTGARLAVRMLGGDGKEWQQALPSAFLQTEDNKVYSGNRRKGSRLVFGPLPACRGTVRLHHSNLVAWPLDVQLVDGEQTTVDLRVQVGVSRRLRFELPKRAADTSLQLRVADAAGRALWNPRIPWPRGQDTVETEVALLPGTWTVTAATDAGERFDGTIEVLDLQADAQPVAVPAAK